LPSPSSQIPVSLKLSLRPKTAPTVYPKFHLKKRHHEHITMQERVEKTIEEFRWKKPVLLAKLETYKKVEKAKKTKAIEESGHNFLEENRDVRGYLVSREEKSTSMKVRGRGRLERIG